MENDKENVVSEAEDNGNNASEGKETPGHETSEAATEDAATDKHGEPAINRGRYERDMRAKDKRIAELEAALEESGKAAKSGDEAKAEIEKLRAELADEKITTALTTAGCIDQKAAKARLGDFDGDIAKLKTECPYLFRVKTGSTGVKPASASSDADTKLDRAFGLKE